MANRDHDVTALGSPEPYDGRKASSGQLDASEPRLSEEDMQRDAHGPRGVPAGDDPARMVPQRDKKTPPDVDPGHTA